MTAFRLFLCITVVALSSSLKAAAPAITDIRVGFGSLCKVGYWTPIWVTLSGDDERVQGQLELIVPDGDGVPTRITTSPDTPVVVPPGKQTTVPLFAKLGQVRAEIRVRLIVNGRAAVEHTFKLGEGSLPTGLGADRSLVLTFGNPLGIEATKAGSEKLATLNQIFAMIDAAEQLPTRWYGYESVDTLILSTSDPAKLAELTTEQVVAIDGWVRLGGRLVLSVGSQAKQVLAEDAPLAKFAPGKFAEIVSLSRTSAWESYVETTDRLDVAAGATPGEFRLESPRLENVRGQIEAFEGARATDLPLVIRTPHGLGEVLFVAADLDQPPFSTWTARQHLLGKLLGASKRSQTQEDRTAPVAAASYGYNDLAGQLRSALEQFPQVRLASFSLVACLVAFYIVAIGPIDYFLVKRVFRRSEWTWFTFTTIVALFGGTAYVLAYSFKGEELRVNQVDVVDFDAETKLVRGTTWSNVFSPKVDTYDLTYEPQLPGGAPLNNKQVLTAWNGLPGEGFGGMGAAAGTAPLFRDPYDFSPSLSSVARLPIAVWSTKGLVGRWTAEAEPIVSAELTDQGDKLLAGTISSQLDAALTDCVLVYDRWAYGIGKLDPHASFSVENKLDPQTVETYFKHISILHEKDAGATYDPASLDVPSIIEMMMFYQHLGGEDYTRLSNQYQHYLDASSLVRAGRAVLLGRGPIAGAELRRDGKSISGEGGQRWTFFRVVFPVAEKPSR